MIQALNSREKKKLLEALNIHQKIPYAVLKEDKTYYLISPDLGKIDLKELNVEALGLLFAREKKGKIEMERSASFLFK